MIKTYRSVQTTWFPDSRIFEWKPRGIIDEESWNQSFDEGVAFYMKQVMEGGPGGWLNDCRQGIFFDLSLLDLLKKKNDLLFMYPGTLKVAFVNSENRLFNAGVNTYIVDTIWHPKNNLSVKKFDDYADAWEWLLVAA